MELRDRDWKFKSRDIGLDFDGIGVPKIFLRFSRDFQPDRAEKKRVDPGPGWIKSGPVRAARMPTPDLKHFKYLFFSDLAPSG